MLRFSGEQLVMFLRKLEVAIDNMNRRSQDEALSSEEVLELDGRLKAHAENFKELHLRRTTAQLALFRLQTVRLSRDGLISCLHNLRHSFQVDLSEGALLRLDQDDADRFEGADCFGPEVAAAFRCANYDTGEARSCYAVGRYTACVFHAMRSLEVGLRLLAAAVDRSYDRQQWHNVIEEIESAIERMRDGKRDAGKDERLKFLSGAAKEFFYFKDGWRNYVMHGRTRYDRPGAFSVLQHVEAFMRHLATNLAEYGAPF